MAHTNDVTQGKAFTAELIKLVTLPIMWLVTAATLLGAAVVAKALVMNAQGSISTTVMLRQVPGYMVVGLVVGAVLAVQTEYTTRQVARTLTCVPRRSTALTAKATALLVWSALTGGAGMVAAALAMSPSTLSNEAPTLVGAVAYLVLMALIAGAITVLLRSLVASLATSLVVLVIAPPLLLTVTRWAQWLPSSAAEQLFADPAGRHADLLTVTCVSLLWPVAAWLGARARFEADA